MFESPARAALDPERVAPRQGGGVPPAWVADWRDWLRAATVAAAGPPPDWLGTKPAPPFVDLLWPLAVARRTVLPARSPSALLRAPAVARGLERTLARWIGYIAAPSLAHDLAGCREPQQPFPVAPAEDLFAARPALARLLTIATGNLLRSVVEFAERYEADRPLLAETFAGGRDLAEPVDLVPDQSDPHRGGRTVGTLVFADGLKIVYKPRPLSMDAVFAGFIVSLNERGLAHPLRPPRMLDRGGHGWCEWIEAYPCSDEAEWEALCWRTGALTAVVFLLEGRDIHHDNIVCAGPQPVIVDAETILHPRFPEWAPARGLTGAEASAWRRLHDSVRRTLMVSEWSRGAGGWRDATAMDHLTALPTPPLPDAPERLVDQVTAGFAAAVRLVGRSSREPGWTADRLEAFGRCRARVVLRPTATYNAILGGSLAAGVMRDGADRSRELERLARRPDPTAVPTPRALLAAEVAALSEGDTPYFSGAPDADEVDGVLGLSGASPLERARQNLEHAGEALLVRQGLFLQGALRARLAPIRCAPAAPSPPAGLLPAEEIAAAALALADELVAAGVAGEDGSLAWIGVFAAEGRHHHQPLGRGLWEGTSGIALALAACHRHGGAARHADAARSALAAVPAQSGTLRAALGQAPPASLAVSLVVAAAEVVHAYLRAAELLGDRAMLATARSCAGELMEIEHWHGAAPSGSAALVYLRCADACGDEALLARALEGARRLATEAPVGDVRQVALRAQLLWLAAERTGDDRLRVAARRIAATLPRRPFQAATALARARLGVDDGALQHLESCLGLDDTVEGGAAGWIDVALDRASSPASPVAAEPEPAFQAASAMVTAARRGGGYALPVGRCAVPLCLGFGGGIAGIAYQLLRTLNPRQLPSVTLLD